MHPAAHASMEYATALHEAAHAVAYMSLRLKFAYISIDEAFTAPDGERLDQWQRAVICMAGPASEGIMYHWETGSDADVLGYILSHRASVLSYIADALDDPEELRCDNSDAGPLAMAALPLALALVTSNWPLIEQIAEAAMGSPAALDYECVLSIAADSVRLDEAEIYRWQGVCSAASK